MTLHEDAEVEHAVVTLTRVLPGAQWDTVQLAPLPTDVPHDVRGSVVAVAGTDPLVYWRPPLNGAVLLHELVHAWQATLPDSAFAKLIESLHARDAHAGFDQGVVEQATRSVVEGLSLTLAHGPPAALQELAERAAMVDAGRPAALARRGDALIRLMTGREWAEARVALTRGVSARQATTAAQRAWTDWVRGFFLLEAQAYEAQARCVGGQPQLLNGW
jgi:hypothetical protein